MLLPATCCLRFINYSAINAYFRIRIFFESDFSLLTSQTLARVDNVSYKYGPKYSSISQFHRTIKVLMLMKCIPQIVIRAVSLIYRRILELCRIKTEQSHEREYTSTLFIYLFNYLFIYVFI